MSLTWIGPRLFLVCQKLLRFDKERYRKASIEGTLLPLPELQRWAYGSTTSGGSARGVLSVPLIDAAAAKRGNGGGVPFCDAVRWARWITRSGCAIGLVGGRELGGAGGEVGCAVL